MVEAPTAVSTFEDLTDTNFTSPADGAIAIYDTGTSMWRDFIMSGDASMNDSGVVVVANDSHTHVIANVTDFTDNSTTWDALVSDTGEPATLASGGTPTLSAGITAGEMQTLLVVDPAGTDNSDLWASF